jgi:hypothetical protein
MEYRLDTHYRSGEVSHVLDAERLVVTRAKTGRTETIPLSSIREINLRQELPGVFTARVARHGGATITIPSRHFLGLGRFEDRSAEYARFVGQLLASCPRGTTRFVAGSSLLYLLGWTVIVGALLLGGLFVFGLATTSKPPPWRVLWTIPLCFVVGGAFLRQGRTKLFDPAQPPAKVFPLTPS